MCSLKVGSSCLETSKGFISSEYEERFWDLPLRQPCPWPACLGGNTRQSQPLPGSHALGCPVSCRNGADIHVNSGYSWLSLPWVPAFQKHEHLTSSSLPLPDFLAWSLTISKHTSLKVVVNLNLQIILSLGPMESLGRGETILSFFSFFQ